MIIRFYSEEFMKKFQRVVRNSIEKITMYNRFGRYIILSYIISLIFNDLMMSTRQSISYL